MSTAAAWQCYCGCLFLACIVLFVACDASADSALASASKSTALSCKSPSLIEVFSRSARDESLVREILDRMCLIPRTVKLNGTSLDRAVQIGDTMVLFYASWCPFSKQVLPLFEAFSSLYPSVHHIVVEHTEARPSTLIKYGVRSFPALLFISGNSRIRYYSKKDLKHMVKFYRAVTGIPPDVKGDTGRSIDWSSRAVLSKQEASCPYPRAISPENWLSDDLYLALAAAFLLLRLVVFPVLAFIRRRYCR